MAYVNYMQVGKTVLVAGIGGTLGGALHFMFLAPQTAGQSYFGIKLTTIVDFIVAFIVGVLTWMYTSKWDYMRIAGLSVSAFTAALGILDALGVMTQPAPTVSLTNANATRFSPNVPRASYLAAPGVIVNKHGSVPEVAAGTFG